MKGVSVFFTTDEGEEMEVDISIHALDKNDTTLRKLAARALLDDLELGRSQVQMQPIGPDQTQCIKECAEHIACSWRLLSKWTSSIVSVQKDSDGLLVPPTSGSALMQTRLLNRNRKVDSLLIKGRFEDEESKTSSSEEVIGEGKSQIPAPLASAGGGGLFGGGLFGLSPEAVVKSAEEERTRNEAERRARDEELHARKEAETRRGFQKGFEELANMIAELAEGVRRKEAEDREAARKEAEERARREEEERRRAEWEREKRMPEREVREAARADAERRLS